MLGAVAGALNQAHADVDLLGEEPQATHRGQQGAPSASELPPWRSENPGAILTDGTVSVHSHKRSQVTRFITDGSQEQGNELAERQSSVPGQEGAGDTEQGSQHLLLIRWLGQRSLTFH